MANPIKSPKSWYDVAPILLETEQFGSNVLSIQISLMNSSLGPKSTNVVARFKLPGTKLPLLNFADL